MLKEELHNISIGDLLNTNAISVRAYTCCENAQLKSLYDIVSYYEHGNSFRNIRNAGILTSKELENLCKDSISQIIIDHSSDENKETEENIFSTNKILIENKYSELLNNCSVRTFNGLSKFSADEFIRLYLNCNRKELFKIKNIGKKSVNEITELREKLNAYIEEIKFIEDSPLKRVKMETKNKYGNFCDCDFVASYFIETNHFPMLWILEQYIKNDYSKSLKILIESFHVFNYKKPLTLEEIAKKHNISRERVRQIRIKVYHEILEITDQIVNDNNKLFEFKALLQNKADWEYLLGIFNETDIVCKESVSFHNQLQEEKCNLTVEFIMQIIAYIFRDKYTLFGGFDLSIRERIWNNTFLVKKQYSNIFNFEKMKVEFSDILIHNEADYLLDIEEYVANSTNWIQFDFSELKYIEKIIREILFYEFHLYTIDLEGHISIPVSKEKSPFKVVYDILKQNGEPMHLDEMFVEFKKILPEHKYSESAQLRPYLQRHEAISYRNRKSVYTLKEWTHIRTGTIRDAIVEFLSEHDLPQTADDITKYVLQYFPETNISSVRTSMFNDTQKRFAFFGDNLFGLTVKVYPIEYEEAEQQESQRKTFAQRLYDFEKFIIENDHFPFSSSEDKNEASLYRWWRLIINGITRLSNVQQSEVKRVKLQYSGYEKDKITYEWNLNYNKLKCFLLENRRTPYARGEERLLYRWLKRASDDFQSYSLNDEQRQKYIELAKLI